MKKVNNSFGIDNIFINQEGTAMEKEKYETPVMEVTHYENDVQTISSYSA